MRYASLNNLFTLFRITAPPIFLEATKPTRVSDEGKYIKSNEPDFILLPMENSSENCRFPLTTLAFARLKRLLTQQVFFCPFVAVGSALFCRPWLSCGSENHEFSCVSCGLADMFFS
jgi:hypothetical protein